MASLDRLLFNNPRVSVVLSFNGSYCLCFVQTFVQIRYRVRFNSLVYNNK